MKKKHLILIIIGTLFIILSIFHNNIWFDEAYSVGLANKTITEIWNIGGHDVHPVLYYWMLRIVGIMTRYSILAYRIFSSIGIIVLGILGYTHIRKDFGEKTGILFSLFTYFLPMMAVYANQIRMYSWAALFATIFFIYTYRIYKGESIFKNWLIFFLASIASMYTHYYGLMTIGITSVLLLIFLIKEKKVKDILKLITIGIIEIGLYIPWIIFLLGQMNHVSGGFWIGFTFPLSMFELVGCQLTGNMPEYIGFYISIVLFVILGVLIYRNKKKESFKPIFLSISIYLLVIIASLIVTFIIKSPILYYRYLFVIIGLYIFTISYILAKESNKKIIYFICLAVIILGIISNVMQIKENYNINNGKQIEYLKNNIKSEDVIVYNNIGNGSVFAVNFKNNKQYFYNKENWGVEEAYKAFSPQMKLDITTGFLKECKGRIWIIDSEDNNFYEELFNNSNYNKISEKRFDTEYQGYIFNIILVEKN